ncbi:SAV_2336 N-terminal domain-related protein [Streptomyces sp. NPDC059785]|uniref:SAV_2336 N-terminal domain-related protein n=1 Tax=Streptomyces sp. NPDC059785 TaxID=3346945 RepID=UPI003646555D
MPADHGTRPTEVARLARLLAEASGGARPTSVELAEVLWLAQHLAGPAGAPGPDAAPDPDSVPAPAPDSVPDPSDGRDPPPATPARTMPPGPDADPDRPPPPPPDDQRVPLHLPERPEPDTPDGADTAGRRGGGASLLAPAPPMLAHPLSLQRALRPLKRRVPAPVGRELDEEATAHRIARLGAAPRWWLPVLRPATERWLTLHLVHDAGPTMPVWRPLVRELGVSLAQSGIFRTVETHRLSAGGRVGQDAGRQPYADGRGVTLLISDCMGPQWRAGPAGARWYRTLRRWAATMPVAVIQPLPERLWRTTALPTATARLAAPWRAAPNAAYTVDSSVTEDLADGLADGVLPLPVLEAAAPWLAHWADLVAGGPEGRIPGCVGLVGAAPPPAPLDAEGRGDVARLSPEELVLRFRSIASPEAFRLAGHLAVGRPELPVMRLVQAAVERDPRPQHLAEVVLSGILATAPGPPGSYVFRPGVREVLLRTLPRTARSRTTELLARAGQVIDAHAGLRAGDFEVVAPGPGEATAAGEPIAAVREVSVRRLGGGPPYAAGVGPEPDGKPAGVRDGEPAGVRDGEPAGDLVGGRYMLAGRRRPGNRLWEAVDQETGRKVVVHLYPRQSAGAAARFLAQARELAELRDVSSLVPVLDHGVEDLTPYLVTEFLEGVTLTELKQGSGPGLPFRQFARLVAQGAAGLAALHARGVVRGQTGGKGVLLRPDGSVVFSRFELGETDVYMKPAWDVARFNGLLQQLAANVSFPAEHTQLLPLIAGGDLPGAAEYAAGVLATPPDTDEFRFDLLGPLRVHRHGVPMAGPFSPEAQALLCLLLLRQGRSATFGEITQGLWGRVTADQQTTDRMHDLATELAPHLGPGTLAALADGYALHVPDARTDVLHCEELLARRDPGADAGVQLALVERALHLFRGTPLDGVPGPAARATRTRLQALRLTLCATRAELDLELGRSEHAEADLRALVAEHPEHQDFRRLHILALRDQGRVTEAIEAYEAYEDHWQQQSQEPLDTTFQELYRELRAAPERPRPTIVFEVEPSENPRPRDVLGRAVTQLLADGDLPAEQYEVLARDNGYAVLTEPDADVLPVLAAVLRVLPGLLAAPEDPPRVTVTFWHHPWFAPADRPAALAALTGPEVQESDVMVVLSPALYEEFVTGPAGADAEAFRPLRPGAPAAPPAAWYRSLPLRPARPPAVTRDLVRGPFTTTDLGRLGRVDQSRTAVVRVHPDGTLAPYNPAEPRGRRPDRTFTYYEVDLTTHRAEHEVSLPSSGSGTFAASVELSWRVDDPAAFVRGESENVSRLLLDHFTEEASRITRRHPLQRAGAAVEAVRTGLRRWPVPGLSVTCLVGPAAPDADRRRKSGSDLWSGADPTLRGLLHDADAVLLGFDGPLAKLFSHTAARRAAGELLALVVEERDPEDALTGRPLAGTAGTAHAAVHPLDVLRAFAHDRRLGPPLRNRLDQLELQAAARSRQTRYATSLVAALQASRLHRCHRVVTDVSEGAVHRHLNRHTLSGALGIHVHARSEDPASLMPDPDCLRRALASLDTPSGNAVVIGSSAAELGAAQALDLPFIGYADTLADADHLRGAGCTVTVRSLMSLVDAVNALPT